MYGWQKDEYNCSVFIKGACKGVKEDIYWYNSVEHSQLRYTWITKKKDIVSQDKLPKDQGLAHCELHPYK